jgi:hypothetical protein
MSLMKLLSVSRSFVNGGGLQGRYRMAEQGMLPKFDSGKAFSSSVTSADSIPQATPEADESFEPGMAVSLPISIDDGSAVSGPEVQPLKRGSVVSAKPDSKPAPAVSKPKAGWVRGIRELRRRWLNPFAGRGRKPGSASESSQGELCLDQVRVVRNDLRDADFEVRPGAAAKGRRFPGAKAAGTAWNRLASRLGSATRSGQD